MILRITSRKGDAVSLNNDLVVLGKQSIKKSSGFRWWAMAYPFARFIYPL